MRKDKKLKSPQIIHITFSDLDAIKMKINVRIRKQNYYNLTKIPLSEEKRNKEKKKGKKFSSVKQLLD